MQKQIKIVTLTTNPTEKLRRRCHLGLRLDQDLCLDTTELFDAPARKNHWRQASLE